MNKETPISLGARRQIIGKRMGLDPYYTVTENTATRLILHSHPGANQKAGHMFMGCGSALLILSVAIFCMTFISSRENFGTFFSGMLLSWPCGVIGGVGIIGGMSIAKIVNAIIIDVENQTITYTQKARRERKQALRFDQIAYLRMSTQLFTPPGFFQRRQPVAVLEFVTNEGQAWLIDSAANGESLKTTAQSFAELLQKEIEWKI